MKCSVTINRTKKPIEWTASIDGVVVARHVITESNKHLKPKICLNEKIARHHDLNVIRKFQEIM